MTTFLTSQMNWSFISLLSSPASLLTCSISSSSILTSTPSSYSYSISIYLYIIETRSLRSEINLLVERAKHTRMHPSLVCPPSLQGRHIPSSAPRSTSSRMTLRSDTELWNFGLGDLLPHPQITAIDHICSPHLWWYLLSPPWTARCSLSPFAQINVASSAITRLSAVSATLQPSRAY